MGAHMSMDRERKKAIIEMAAKEREIATGRDDADSAVAGKAASPGKDKSAPVAGECE